MLRALGLGGAEAPADAALKRLGEARDFEKAGRSADALRCYEEGLASLLKVLKAERDASKRSALTDQVERFMAQAERLKQQAAQPAPSKQQAARPAKQQAARLPDHFNYGASKPKSAHAPPAAAQTASSEDARLEEQILSEMLDSASGVRWIDIAGLEDAKRTLHEAVVLPCVAAPANPGTVQRLDARRDTGASCRQLRPDLFFGLRAPPRGVLLFGPPGTGKTLLAKAVAGESSCTFFAVSASSLTSKWVGEGEKLVKALFAVGRKRSPSVVFLDELDALLGQRGASGEHEASRRLKTEFFVQLDGVATNTDQRLLFMGATNRPWDLDDALLRRVPRRILIPLPDSQARGIMLLRLISQGGVSHALTQRDRDRIVNATATFSMSDLRSLAEEAALAPLRDLGDRVRDAKTGEVRPIVLSDFTKALKTIKPSADAQTLGRYDEWAMQFGTRG